MLKGDFIPVSHITVTTVAPDARCSGDAQSGGDVGARGACPRTGLPRGPAAWPWRWLRLSRPARSDRRASCRQSGTTKPGADAVDLVRARRAARQHRRFVQARRRRSGSRSRRRRSPSALPRSDARRADALDEQRRPAPAVWLQISSRHRVIAPRSGPRCSVWSVQKAVRVRGDRSRSVDHVAGQLRCHASTLALDDLQPGAEKSHMVTFLLRECVRRNDV